MLAPEMVILQRLGWTTTRELVFAKLATLPEQAVHQAGLAMVDMGDDGNIAEVGTRHAAAVCRDGGSVKEGDYGGHEEDRQHRLGTGVAAVSAKSPMVRLDLIIRFSLDKTSNNLLRFNPEDRQNRYRILCFARRFRSSCCFATLWNGR